MAGVSWKRSPIGNPKKSRTSLAGTPLEDSSRSWDRHCRRVCPGHPPLPGARSIVVDLLGDLLLRVWWCALFFPIEVVRIGVWKGMGEIFLSFRMYAYAY
jgi:hypothetical protein